MARNETFVDIAKDRWTKENYKPIEGYGESKVANILFARELQYRFPQVVSVSLHPGYGV